MKIVIAVITAITMSLSVAKAQTTQPVIAEIITPGTPLTLPNWNMTWKLYGKVVGWFDIGIGGTPSHPDYTLAQPPAGATCLSPNWSYGETLFSGGTDCVNDLQNTTIYLFARQHGTSGAWAQFDHFTLLEVDPVCCSTQQGNCTGSMEGSQYVGPCQRPQ